MRFFGFLALALITFTSVRAQDTLKKSKPFANEKVDTIKPYKYVNQGKIAAHKAVLKSLIFPGLGQVYNYGLVVKDVQSGTTNGKRVGQKIYIIGKIAAIYAGGTLLVKSYLDNRDKYKLFLSELQYRKLNNNKPSPDNGLEQYTNTSALVVAKDIYKRNSQVVLISIAGLYGLNVLDAYVTARLKYFSVDENLSLKISPSLINTNAIYGFSAPTPAIKFTFKL